MIRRRAGRAPVAGKHVLVTGGSKGIGAALARDLADRGARLTLVARPSAELKEVSAATGAHAVEADLSDHAALTDLVAGAERVNGPVDVLVNNAALARNGPYPELAAEDIRVPICANLLAPMELIRQVLPGMTERGRGAIVNVSSAIGEISVPNSTGYAVSKCALTKLTLDLQVELRGSGVRVLLFVLGLVGDTGIVREFARDPVGARAYAMVQKLPPLTTDDVALRMIEVLQSGKDRAVVTLPAMATPLITTRTAPYRAWSRLVGRYLAE